MNQVCKPCHDKGFDKLDFGAHPVFILRNFYPAPFGAFTLTGGTMVRSLLQIVDFTPAELQEIFDLEG